MNKRFSIPLAVLIIALFSFALIGADRIPPQVHPSKCVGCGDCVKICPRSSKGAISIIHGKAVIDPESCISCNRCVEICGYEAIRAKRNGESEE